MRSLNHRARTKALNHGMLKALHETPTQGAASATVTKPPQLGQKPDSRVSDAFRTLLLGEGGRGSLRLAKASAT